MQNIDQTIKITSLVIGSIKHLDELNVSSQNEPRLSQNPEQQIQDGACFLAQLLPTNECRHDVAKDIITNDVLLDVRDGMRESA